jgi:hypothetical protein
MEFKDQIKVRPPKATVYVLATYWETENPAVLAYFYSGKWSVLINFMQSDFIQTRK